MLLTELAKRVQDAKAKGDAAPNFDLCKVTVKKSNLFCAESQGILRVHMPQLSGPPIPGSKADGMEKNAKGEVVLTAEFRKMLEARGVTITDDSEKAAFLKASQIEINGGKVAAMVRVLDDGGTLGGDPRLFVSSDNYIVDGHHRWAANVGHDLGDGELGGVEMPVARVDMDIVTLLFEANAFAKEWGIPQAGVADAGPRGAGKASPKGEKPDRAAKIAQAQDALRAARSASSRKALVEELDGLADGETLKRSDAYWEDPSQLVDDLINLPEGGSLAFGGVVINKPDGKDYIVHRFDVSGSRRYGTFSTARGAAVRATGADLKARGSARGERPSVAARQAEREAAARVEAERIANAGPPLMPRVIRGMDNGAEWLGTLPDGSTIWHTVTSPPSGIERDRVVVAKPDGTTRAATDRDMDRAITPSRTPNRAPEPQPELPDSWWNSSERASIRNSVDYTYGTEESPRSITVRGKTFKLWRDRETAGMHEGSGDDDWSWMIRMPDGEVAAVEQAHDAGYEIADWIGLDRVKRR